MHSVPDLENHNGSNSACVSCRASTPMPDGLLRMLRGRRCLVRLLHVIGLLILMLGAPIPAMAQPATPATSSPRAASGDFAGLVDIGGGRGLYLECHGQGSPTVILEAGLLSRSDVWSRDSKEPEGARTMVLPGVAAFTRVCAYDRPGTIGAVNPDLDPDDPLFYPSRSDPVPQPRTVEDMVADLHSLLVAADVPGPYVLVGHSAGGLVVRLYASTYPDEVVGMVLVDATPEDVWLRFQEALTPAQWTVRSAHRHQSGAAGRLSGGGAALDRAVDGRRQRRPGASGAAGDFRTAATPFRNE